MPYQHETIKLAAQLPNQNSFFSEICSSNGKRLRLKLNSILHTAPSSVAQRWNDHLHSFDNALLFQSVSEMLSCSSLQEQGWSVRDYDQRSATLNVQHYTGQQAKLLCLSYLCDRNVETEQHLATHLQEQLNQLKINHKIALIYRKPPQSALSTEKAVVHFKKWLSSTRKDRDTGFYRDEYNWIECKILPSKSCLSEKVVQFTQRSLCSSCVLEHIDQTANLALEQIRLQQLKDVPVILSIVSNQQFHITPNAWRFFFYGPTSQVSDGTYRHDADQMRGWMHDPFRTFLTGILRIECRFQEDKDIEVSSFENPWCEFSGFGAKLPPPRLVLIGKERLDPILKYQKY